MLFDQSFMLASIVGIIGNTIVRNSIVEYLRGRLIICPPVNGGAFNVGVGSVDISQEKVGVYAFIRSSLKLSC